MNEAVKAWLRDRGYPLGEVDVPGLDGRLHSERADIAGGLSPDGELLALLHEGAHVLLGHLESDYRRSHTPREIACREASAESVALRAGRILGKDLAPSSGDYLKKLGRYTLDRRVSLVADELAALVISYRYGNRRGGA